MDNKSFYKEFGKLLKDMRITAELTQSELAERVGLSRTSVTNIEVGRQKIPLHLLYELASSLGVEPAALLPKKENLSVQSILNENISEYLKDNSGLNHDSQGWLSRVLKARPAEQLGGDNEITEGGKRG